MKLNIKDLVQGIVINSNFFPLTYFYKKIYDLSIAVAKFLLRRERGVLTIYLRRGAATGEIIYGLSDIDLLVIVDDKNKEEKVVKLAKEKVISTYNRLSYVIPLFSRAKEELGVYSTSEFFRLYADNDSFRYRFNEGKNSWKLLFGQDLLRELPELRGVELYLPATEELKIWWPLVNIELAPDFAAPQFRRKYLWYKAISEVSKIYLFICHGENIQSREAALYRIKEYLAYEHRGCIDKVQGYLKDLTSKEDLIPDELMRLFIELASEAFSEMERKVYRDSKGKMAIINAPNYQDLIIDSNVTSLIGKLEMHVGRELEPYLDYVALIPQVDFSMDVLHNTDIDSLYLVLVQRDFVPVEKLRVVNVFLAENASSQIIEPFITYGDIALSLKGGSWYQCIRSPKQCPLFYPLLLHDRLNLFKKSDKTQGKSIQSDLPPSFRETIQKRKAKINQMTSSKDVYKLETLNFLRFFWGAARTKLLSYSTQNNEIHIPITSKQVQEMLVQFSPENSDWLNDLYLEYKKELLGEESNAYRFFTKSIDFLRRI